MCFENIYEYYICGFLIHFRNMYVLRIAVACFFVSLVFPLVLRLFSALGGGVFLVFWGRVVPVARGGGRSVFLFFFGALCFFPPVIFSCVVVFIPIVT